MRTLLVIPPLVVGTVLYIALFLIVAVLHLLFRGLHLHWLAKNMTDPIIDQFIRMGRWGQKLVDRREGS